MKYFIKNLKNKIDFYLRAKINLSRKGYFEENESKEGLFSDEKILKKEAKLFDKYNLSSIKQTTTRYNYLENLYTLDLLDRFLDVSVKNELGVLDIGCKNWFYAKGEHSFFEKHCDKLAINGIELDANILYSNFYSRAEVAKFYIKDLVGAKFLEGDFLKHNERYDYMVWILPFVFESPLLMWGLPKNYFKPKEMLKHAYDMLNGSGKIFIVNQGLEEYNEQKSLCDDLKLPYRDIGAVQSDFLEYKHQRCVIIVEKP